MNTGTEDGGGVTTVGERGFYMANAHVAHDCHVGSDVVFANCATLAGHCDIGDHVFIGGLSAVHQYTRIGPHAMIGGISGVRGDVIPFALANGQITRLSGINIVGLRRRGFSAATITVLRRLYRTLFQSAGSMAERIAAAENEHGGEPAAKQLLEFVRTRGKRPLCRSRGHATSASE
jgi:UDP-N-acetylglucosamine acyltransferase